MSKMKKFIALLLCSVMILMSTSTLCLAVEGETGAEDTKQEVVEISAEDIKLNTRVKFKGNTYFDIKCTNKRKEYTEETSGIIFAVHKRYKCVYIMGKGYVKYEDIKEIEGKVMSYDRETRTYRYDGDLIKVESQNNGIIDFKDGKLVAGIDGTTDIKLYDIKGKELADINAEVKGSEIVLNFPEGEFNAKLEEATVVITTPEGEEVAKLTASADAKLDVDIKDGALTVTASGNADSDLTVKGKEILSVEAAGNADINANLTEGITASGNSSGTLTLLDKIKAKLSGGASANVNATGVEVSANGEATVDEKQIAAGEATTNVKYNGDASLTSNGSVFGYQLPSLNKTGNLISMLKKLFK